MSSTRGNELSNTEKIESNEIKEGIEVEESQVIKQVIPKKHSYKYYSIVKRYYDENKNDEMYNFEEWLKTKKDSIDKNMILKREHIRYKIEKAEFVEERFYIIKLFKVRLEQEISKIVENNPVETIKLADDEYVGLPTMLLYDTKLNRCMVKSNRLSLTERDYLKILSETLGDEAGVALVPFMDEKFADKLKNGEIEKIELTMFGLNNVDKKKLNKKSSLFKSAKNAVDMGANNLKLELGKGRAKGKFLNKKDALEMLKDMSSMKNNISRAKVVISNGNETEIFEYFNAILKSEIIFKIDPRGSVQYSNEKIEMMNEYKNKMD